MNLFHSVRRRPFQAGLMFMVLLLVTGCGNFLDEGPGSEFCNDTEGLIKDFGQIDLPPSATNLDIRCSRWMDHQSLNLRFEMLPEDLSAFQESTLIEEWLDKPDNAPAFTFSFSHLDSGDLEAMPSYIYGVHAPMVPVIQQIVIDTSDPALYTVYLLAFQSY